MDAPGSLIAEPGSLIVEKTGRGRIAAPVKPSLPGLPAGETSRPAP